jgi:phosphoribosylformylglycinamidine (FGAM) synthase PurS component
MKYRAKIEVSLKPGHSNPEGETTAHLLKELGYKAKSTPEILKHPQSAKPKQKPKK